MFTKVIVGVDGYEGGHDAVALAAALAPAGALTLLNAYPYEPHPSPGALEAYGRLLRQEALETLERTRRDVGVDAGMQAVAEVSPAKALHRAAQDQRADLLVVGSCHRGAAGRTLLGDVGRGVLHHSPCAVAVAPQGFASRRTAPAVIGVAFDGSPESRAALEAAHQLAADVGGRLRLRVVAEAPTAVASAYAYALDWDALVAEHRRQAQRLLDEALTSLDVPAEGEVVVGSPAADLQALTEHVDLIVTGSRDWGPLRRVALGSTSDRLVHHALCPVLVVPRPAVRVDDREPAVAAVETGR